MVVYTTTHAGSISVYWITKSLVSYLNFQKFFRHYPRKLQPIALKAILLRHHQETVR